MTFLEVLTKGIEKILSRAFPLFDISRTYTLTGSLTALSSEDAKKVTLINTTGGDLSISVNLGGTIVLPTATGATFLVDNTDKIKVSGSGTLYYIISH